MVSSTIPILDNVHAHNTCAYMCGGLVSVSILGHYSIPESLDLVLKY